MYKILALVWMLAGALAPAKAFAATNAAKAFSAKENAALLELLIASEDTYSANPLVHSLAYASTNVTTGAYVTLVASTRTTVSSLAVCDTSTKIVGIAVGAAGAEHLIFNAPVSGCIQVPYYLPAGTRLSIKAIDASATTGYNVLSLIP